MQRGFVTLLSGFVVAGLTIAWPAPGFGAAQVKLGRSGYSGTLSSDPLTRSQQLLCDPDAVADPGPGFDPDAVLVSGSMSTYYNAGIVTLLSLTGAPGFAVIDAYVQVQDTSGKHLITYSLYQTHDFSGVETGYLQVLFKRTAVVPPSTDGPFFAAAAAPPTYHFEDHDGTNGDITHELYFQYKSVDTPPNTVVQYTNFADFGPNGTGGRPNDGSAPDSLTFRSATLGDVVYTADQIDPATVRGDLVPNAAVPLPSAALGGLALLGGLGLTRRRGGQDAAA